MLRFRDFGVFVFETGCFVFEMGCFVFEFGCFVLRSSFSSASFSKLPHYESTWFEVEDHGN